MEKSSILLKHNGTYGVAVYEDNYYHAWIVKPYDKITIVSDTREALEAAFAREVDSYVDRKQEIALSEIEDGCEFGDIEEDLLERTRHVGFMQGHDGAWKIMCRVFEELQTELLGSGTLSFEEYRHFAIFFEEVARYMTEDVFEKGYE